MSYSRFTVGDLLRLLEQPRPSERYQMGWHDPRKDEHIIAGLEAVANLYRALEHRRRY